MGSVCSNLDELVLSEAALFVLVVVFVVGLKLPLADALKWYYLKESFNASY